MGHAVHHLRSLCTPHANVAASTQSRQTNKQTNKHAKRRHERLQAGWHFSITISNVAARSETFSDRPFRDSQCDEDNASATPVSAFRFWNCSSFGVVTTVQLCGKAIRRWPSGSQRLILKQLRMSRGRSVVVVGCCSSGKAAIASGRR